ncbi:MAG: ABC transporter substrate-binding protein [Candidatus Odinarchaeia archaeon]
MKKGIKIGIALFLTVALVASGAVLLWNPAAAQAQQTLKIASPSDPVTLDPYDSWDSASNDIILNIYDTLVMYVPSTLDFRPGLAAGWQVMPNGTMIIFNIRQNVTFHNGDPMTPWDVWWSIERALPLDHRSAAFNATLANATWNPNKYNWSELDKDRKSGIWHVWDPIINVTVADVGFNASVDYTGENATAGDGWNEIVVEFSSAFSPGLSFFSYAGLSIVNPDVAISLGPTNMQFAPVGAGTGPYKFVEWVTNSHVKLEYNPDYWGTVPSIPNVEFRTIPEATTRTLSLQTGDVHLLYPEAADFYTFQADPNIETWQEAGLGTRYLGFNVRQNITNQRAAGALSDPIVREALSYAVNYDEILLGEEFNNGLATRMLGPMVPTIPWAYIENISQVNETSKAPYNIIPNFNITRANEILDNAGITDVDGDGIRDYKGWTNSSDDMVFRYGYNIGNAVREAIGELLYASFSEINVSIVIEGRTWDQFLAAMTTGELDLFFIGWGPDYIDPDTYFYPLFHSDFIGTYGNAAGVNDTKIDNLLEQGRTETNQTIRAEIYKNLTLILVDAFPWAWCYIPDNAYAWRAELDGFTHSPFLQMDDLELCSLGAAPAVGIPIEIIAIAVGVVVVIAIIGGVIYYKRSA